MTTAGSIQDMPWLNQVDKRPGSVAARRQYHVFSHIYCPSSLFAGDDPRVSALVNVDGFARPDEMNAIFRPSSTGCDDEFFFPGCIIRLVAHDCPFRNCSPYKV